MNFMPKLFIFILVSIFFSTFYVQAQPKKKPAFSNVYAEIELGGGLTGSVPLSLPPQFTAGLTVGYRTSKRVSYALALDFHLLFFDRVQLKDQNLDIWDGLRTSVTQGDSLLPLFLANATAKVRYRFNPASKEPSFFTSIGATAFTTTTTTLTIESQKGKRELPANTALSYGTTAEFGVDIPVMSDFVSIQAGVEWGIALYHKSSFGFTPYVFSAKVGGQVNFSL
jgi:hypothetical protein